jgi:dihydroneopterin aldolase
LSDIFRLNGLTVFGHDGAPPAERESAQKIELDIEILADWTDLRAACQSDSMKDTITFEAVCAKVLEIAPGREHQSLEALGEDICYHLLKSFPISSVSIQLRKLNLSFPNNLSSFEVLLTRKASIPPRSVKYKRARREPNSIKSGASISGPMKTLEAGKNSSARSDFAARSTAPKISVLIPSYNNARYLPEAIESVLEQDFQDFELVVVDNCSQDGSQEAIRRFAARDNRIRFQANESNIGMVGNFNRCLSLAQGEYVQFLMSDDKLACRSALTRMVELIESEPSAILAACARLLIDADSNVIGCADDWRADGLHPGPAVILKCLEKGNLIGEPTVVIARRSSFQRGFNPEFQMLLDLEMWLHLLEQGNMVFSREPLCGFRQHPDQQSKAKGMPTGPQELLLLVAKYRDKPWLHALQVENQLFSQIYDRRRNGGTAPEAKALTASMLEVLGRRRYARLWARRKATRPFVKLKRFCSKRARHLKRLVS